MRHDGNTMNRQQQREDAELLQSVAGEEDPGAALDTIESPPAQAPAQNALQRFRSWCWGRRGASRDAARKPK